MILSKKPFFRKNVGRCDLCQLPRLQEEAGTTSKKCVRKIKPVCTYVSVKKAWGLHKLLILTNTHRKKKNQETGSASLIIRFFLSIFCHSLPPFFFFVLVSSSHVPIKTTTTFQISNHHQTHYFSRFIILLLSVLCYGPRENECFKLAIGDAPYAQEEMETQIFWRLWSNYKCQK